MIAHRHISKGISPSIDGCNYFPVARYGKVAVLISSPGKTRTCDPLINSQLLYQLSYRGV